MYTMGFLGFVSGLLAAVAAGVRWSDYYYGYLYKRGGDSYNSWIVAWLYVTLWEFSFCTGSAGQCGVGNGGGTRTYDATAIDDGSFEGGSDDGFSYLFAYNRYITISTAVAMTLLSCAYCGGATKRYVPACHKLATALALALSALSFAGAGAWIKSRPEYLGDEPDASDPPSTVCAAGCALTIANGILLFAFGAVGACCCNVKPSGDADAKPPGMELSTQNPVTTVGQAREDAESGPVTTAAGSNNYFARDAFKSHLSGSSMQPATEADASAAAGDLPAQLQKIADLHASGVLNDEEYAAAKAKLLR